jgi:hypothetical protein
MFSEVGQPVLGLDGGACVGRGASARRDWPIAEAIIASSATAGAGWTRAVEIRFAPEFAILNEQLASETQTSGDWTSSLGWLPIGVPGAGDSAVFSVAGGDTVSVGSSDTIAVTNVTMTSSGAELDVDGALTLSGVTDQTGTIAVEALREGDLVPTLTGDAPAPVVWIGRRDIGRDVHPEPSAVCPVRVAAGAFGKGLPRRDLYVSPDHAVYANGVLIPVKHLINGGSIRREERDHIRYFHVELPSREVIRAEGLPVER